MPVHMSLQTGYPAGQTKYPTKVILSFQTDQFLIPKRFIASIHVYLVGNVAYITNVYEVINHLLMIQHVFLSAVAHLMPA